MLSSIKKNASKKGRNTTSISAIYKSHLGDILGISLKKVREWYNIGSKWASLIGAGASKHISSEDCLQKI
jgi:hypothetical protein